MLAWFGELNAGERRTMGACFGGWAFAGDLSCRYVAGDHRAGLNMRNGIRVVAAAPGGTDAPPRRIPRNTAERSAEEKIWYQGIVDQTISSSLIKRCGTLQ